MARNEPRPDSDSDAERETRDPGWSDPAVESDLDAALDSFLDWADEEKLLDDVDLPEIALTPLARGTVLGDFELLRSLGAGSMGVVYEARQRSVPGRTVAIKVMRSVLASKRLRERFRREVAVIGYLDHPHVVPVLAAGIERDLPYYAMKLLEGVSGAELIERLRDRGGTPTMPAVQRLLEGTSASRGSTPSVPPTWESSYVRWIARCCQNIADALQHAHDQGIVHRDVKPANMMFTTTGRPMLMDFGLASDASDVTLTRSGDFLGTMAYASPEQVRGEEVDARSDIFSLGATLYELLSLERAFPSSSRSELLHAIEFKDPAELGPDIPVDLRTICMQALAKNPRQRYATCAAMANDLRDLLAGRSIQARPPGFLARTARVLRRHPRIVATVGMGLLLVGGLAARDRWRAHACVRGARAELDACIAAVEAGALPGPELLDRFRQTKGELRAAFRYSPGYRPARSALASLHAAELRLQLDHLADIYAPDHVRDLEQRIAMTRLEHDHGALLDATGWLSLESDPPGAHVRLWREQADGNPTVLEGETPQRFERLPEGTYFAEFEAPGRVRARTHLLVRRTAVDADDPHPSRRVSVRLPTPDEVRTGYRYIPGGWSFIEDDPPVYEYVESFWIRELETTFGEWVAWMNDLEAAGLAPWSASNAPDDPQWKPRLGPQPSAWEVRRDDDGRWACAPGVDPSWPVRGLKPTEMHAYVRTLDIARGETRDETCPALPSRAQLMRAARGADVRLYPWGNEFDPNACANYLSRETWGQEPFPHPVGRFPGDESPFGVRDLAGSIREATLSAGGPLRGEIAVCFGSYRSTDERALRLTSHQSESNEPIGDVGFRSVLNSWPEWALNTEGPPAFHDDFERPDSDSIGAGWAETQGELFDQDQDPLMEERCSIAGGRLVVEGGVGNFSELSTAWYPIAPAEWGYRTTALVAATCETSTTGRWAGIKMRTHLRAVLDTSTQLGINCMGEVWLRNGETGVGTPRGTCELGSFYWLRLEARPDGLRAWYWPADGQPSPAPDLELPSTKPWIPARYLTLTSACYIGSRLEVEELEHLSLGPAGRAPR